MHDNPTTGSDPLRGTMGILHDATLVPRPLEYGVKVDGKIVAFIAPEEVERAYLKFQTMLERSQRRRENLVRKIIR